VEALDLADRGDDPGHARRDAVDGHLDRPERVVQRVLEVTDERVRGHRHEDERRRQEGDEDDRPAAGGAIRE
jgi:hypothetical protein